MGNTCWSSSSSLPNMKAIHWRIKVTYNFEKRLTWDDARRQPIRRPPDHCYFKWQIFGKNPSKKPSATVVLADLTLLNLGTIVWLGLHLFIYNFERCIQPLGKILTGINGSTSLGSQLTVNVLFKVPNKRCVFFLTHCSLETPKRVIGKPCRARLLIRVSTICK